jgi:hypothetical protein
MRSDAPIALGSSDGDVISTFQHGSLGEPSPTICEVPVFALKAGTWPSGIGIR